MLVKYLIFVFTPLAIVHLAILLLKHKSSKFLVIIIIIATLIIISGSLILLYEIYNPTPQPIRLPKVSNF